MTRSNFALLVCRVVGILSVLYLMQGFLEAKILFKTFISPYLSRADHWNGFPTLAFSCALLVFGGGILALPLAQMIATKAEADGANRVRGLPLFVAAVACWFLVVETSAGILASGIIHWGFVLGKSYDNKFMEMVSESGDGTGRGLTRLLLRLLFLLLCMVALTWMAIRRESNWQEE